ncbi:unnamed protein product [Closterium sp. NIES-64]|nr:unnamed protein product [Closterium sp. NIES-64]CAI5963453.1 unnamed protein product [Closterium sp. NIES-65]
MVDTTVNAQVYDIDGFGTPAATIRRLQAAGRKVICYFSFGSAEDYRADYSLFPRSTLGGLVCNSDDCSEVWEGERWLDVRSNVVRSVLEKRVKLAKRKGCDGIEPDNLDAWSNNIMYKTISRFKITAADQANFNLWIARTVHKYGMSVGLKNPGSLLPSQMAAAFDWALVEQCNEYSVWGGGGAWYSGRYGCDYANEFIVRSKAVFIAEPCALTTMHTASQYDAPLQHKDLEPGYATPPPLTSRSLATASLATAPPSRQAMCADNNAHGFTTRLYNMDLEPGYRYPFADCLRHKPAGCNSVWQQCVQPTVYQSFMRSGMKRWDAVGQCMRSKSAGGVLAQLRGSSVAADALTAPGDANATGVLEITLLQNGTDYDVAFTARISLSTDAAPTALTLNSGTAATTGAALLDFSTATGTDGASPPAWTSAASPSPGSGPMGRAWGRLQRAVGRSARLAGLHTFTLTGVWRAAATVAAEDGVQTVKDVALALVMQPRTFYALVASPGFEAGAARGQFQKAPKGWAFGLRN